MNKSGSMDRTLTPKLASQMTLRQICQWTAATSLVAAGSVALFSASTLEKLSQNGEVAVDLSAFTKLASTTLALERVDEKVLLAEDDRILEKSLFAQAERLPVAKTKFKPITKHSPRKAQIPHIALRIEQGPKDLTVLTPAEVQELSALERAPDPQVEAAAMAGLYRRVRFQFIAATDSIKPTSVANAKKHFEIDYSAESVKIAQSNPAHEYDEVPTFDAADFPATQEIHFSASSASPSPRVSNPTLADPVPTAKSDQLTADSSVLIPALKGEVTLPSKLITEPASVASDHQNVITTPGIDLVPDTNEAAQVVSQTPSPVSTQNNAVKLATGPPEPVELPKTELNESLHAVAPSTIDSAPENSLIPSPAAPPVTQKSPPADVTTPKEYSADIASIYDMKADSPSDLNDIAGDYSEDAEYSARPKRLEGFRTGAQSIQLKDHHTIEGRTVNFGNGVSQDAHGITIAMNDSGTRNPNISVSRPGEKISKLSLDPKNSEVAQSLSKFSFDSSALVSPDGIRTSASSLAGNSRAAGTPEVSPPAEIDLKKCDTARLGVEAFNPAAEKETLSICRRVLSQEGIREGTQAKWWESYATEKEHWPTLAFLRESQISESNRVPMLSNASIRILSALSKTNTHTGTGILFGEIPRGLEIQLIGRSDSPIYFDGGMKVKDTNTDPTALRQFVFLNVEPGQPLLLVKDSGKARTGAIPLVVKAGIATYLKVPELKNVDLSFSIFDASARTEKHLAGLTAEIVGQAGKMGISDTHGNLKISKVTVMGDFPLYVDLVQNEKGYKNRYRVRPEDRDLKSGSIPLFFFNEKRVDHWIKQLAGGVSPMSGLIVGVLPNGALAEKKGAEKNLKLDRTLRIGTLEKKGNLVPERYALTTSDLLEIKHSLAPNDNRFIGVQIPEGAAIPSLIDEKGALLWSEIVYSQPGVINVVGP